MIELFATTVFALTGNCALPRTATCPTAIPGYETVPAAERPYVGTEADFHAGCERNFGTATARYCAVKITRVGELDYTVVCGEAK